MRRPAGSAGGFSSAGAAVEPGPPRRLATGTSTNVSPSTLARVSSGSEAVPAMQLRCVSARDSASARARTAREHRARHGAVNQERPARGSQRRDECARCNRERATRPGTGPIVRSADGARLDQSNRDRRYTFDGEPARGSAPTGSCARAFDSTLLLEQAQPRLSDRCERRAIRSRALCCAIPCGRRPCAPGTIEARFGTGPRGHGTDDQHLGTRLHDVRPHTCFR